MIPDVYLPLVLPGGTPGGFVARDVPAAVFFYGWPGEGAHVEHLELWRERLLPRVVVEPAGLTLQTVQHLGDAIRPTLSAYLRAVGWPETDYPNAAAQVAAPAVGRTLLADVPTLTAPPHPHLAQAMARWTEEWRLSPLALWQGPISEFLWVLALSRARDGRPAAGAFVDEDGIGMEDAS